MKTTKTKRGRESYFNGYFHQVYYSVSIVSVLVRRVYNNHAKVWGKVVFLGHTLKEIRFAPEDHRSEFGNEQAGPVKKRKKEEHREILDTK